MEFIAIKMMRRLPEGFLDAPSGGGWQGCRFDVGFDWVCLEFALSSRTHYRHVREELGVPFAEALECGPGAYASHFRVKFHDVTRYSTLVYAVRQLRHRWGLAGPVRVWAIELAADLYPNDPKGKADLPMLAELGARWYQCMDTVVRENHRLYRTKRDLVKQEVPASVPALADLLQDGWQLGMGPRDAPVNQHLYVKTTDQNGQPVAPDRYRTRLELRISGDAGWSHFGWPGVPTLDQLEDLTPPTKMVKHFYRRQIAAEPTEDAARQLVLPAMPQPLRRWDMPRLRGGGMKAYPTRSRADAAFNKQMGQAFRLFRSVWKRPY